VLYSPRVMDTQVDTCVGEPAPCSFDTQLSSPPGKPGRFTYHNAIIRQ
jgi:hypothetical protein